MIHTVVVPGVGGSEAAHWQTWLQQQLQSSSRVQQRDWNCPKMTDWVESWVEHVAHIPGFVQVVAHSFGCLVSVAALNQYPQLQSKVKNMILVAPANPARFGEAGFAKHSLQNYLTTMQNYRIRVPTTVLLSENDPWFELSEALNLVQAWQVNAVILGAVGHINVASGFGPFPAIFEHLLPEKKRANGIFAPQKWADHRNWAKTA